MMMPWYSASSFQLSEVCTPAHLMSRIRFPLVLADSWNVSLHVRYNMADVSNTSTMTWVELSTGCRVVWLKATYTCRHGYLVNGDKNYKIIYIPWVNFISTVLFYIHWVILYTLGYFTYTGLFYIHWVILYTLGYFTYPGLFYIHWVILHTLGYFI